MSESDPVKIAARWLYDRDCRNAKDGGATAFPTWDYVEPVMIQDAQMAISALESAGFKLVAREATEEQRAAWYAPGCETVWTLLFDAAPDYSTPPSPAGEKP